MICNSIRVKSPYNFIVGQEPCTSSSRKEINAMCKQLSFLLMIGVALGAYGQTAHSASPYNLIPVPVLVEDSSGEMAFGLSAQDFLVKDNGVEQRVAFSANARTEPLSLLIVIQTGHHGSNRLNKISRLDDLLDGLLSIPHDKVAVLTFDSVPRLLQDFTESSDVVSSTLASIAPGDDLASLIDALHSAATTLHKSPVNSRRIVLLISEELDHGSDDSDWADLIQDLSSNNISVYALSYSASHRPVLGKLRALNPLEHSKSNTFKNSTEALARFTGGDFYHFNSEKSFENEIGEISDHIHNRYDLELYSNNFQPGFHSLQIELRHVRANIVAARSGYWYESKGSGGTR